jgi:hypothetical protein
MVTISIELAIDRSSERASEAERNAASDHTQPCTAMAMPWPPGGGRSGLPKTGTRPAQLARIMLFCPPMKGRIHTYLGTERNLFLPLKTFNNNRKQISLPTFSFQLCRPIIFNVPRKEELK